MKNYLVTGGSGFIGSNFIHYLFGQYGEEIQVINLDALTYCGNNDNLGDINNRRNYTFVHGDVCDEELLVEILEKYHIDYVVHFAAESHVDRSITNANNFIRTNIVGTHALLSVVKSVWGSIGNAKDTKRLLYISTDEVYGELSDVGYFTEETSLAPRNPYAVSKASADMLVKAFYETYQLPVLITRCSNNYGPKQYQEKLIPICIKQLLEGRNVKLYGNGKNVRDWLYVTDHCNAIDTVLTKGIIGEVYNIGGHNEKTNIEIVNSIRDILQDEYHLEVPGIQFVEDRKGHDYRYAMNPEKITNELGWRAKVPFDIGIRETVRWYMDHQALL